MREQPDIRAVLELARAIVRTELVHVVPDDKRYEALMVANVLGIAQRALDAPEGLDAETLRALAAAIRQGRHDGDADVFNQLMDEVETRVAVSNPKALG